MALTPETGSGVAGADSYFALTASTAYWTARPHDALGVAWLAALSTVQDGAAREASAYLDATYGALYIGSRKTAAQGLLWPRVNRTVLDRDDYDTIEDMEAAQAETDKALVGRDGLELAALPTQVVNAAIELAARALTARLAKDQSSDGWLKRRKVGDIEREWGAPGVPGGTYGVVDDLLAPVLLGKRNASWAWA